MTEDTSFFSDEDWEHLLPGKTITIGKKSILIKPFGLEDYIHVTKKLTAVKGKFVAQGITRENFQGEKLPEVASLILSEVPELVARATGIPEKELLRLPLSPCVEIASTIIDVNLESQQGLEKNFHGLVAGLAKLNSPTVVEESTGKPATKKRKRK